MNDTFVCYRCRFPKPISEKCSNRMCKECFSSYKKDRYASNPVPTLKKTREYRRKNREKLRRADKVWREKNPEKNAARTRDWAKANPVNRLESQQRRRARKAGSQVVKITKAMLSDRLSVFDGLCAYCGAPYEHWDHVKPLELGGPHILSNLRPSCARCNLRKGSMPAKDWLLALSPRPSPPSSSACPTGHTVSGPGARSGRSAA